MGSESFLEKVYQGTLDARIFNRFKVPQETERIERLLARFRELLQTFPLAGIEEQGKVPAEMLEKMGEIGLFGIIIPQAYGGLGFSLWEYLKTVEAITRMDLAVGMVSIAHLSIGLKGILLFGTEAQKQKYLVPAASGKMVFSYALTEPRFGSDAQHIETRAELSPDGTHYILNGQKTYITNANYAGGLTVFAQLDPQRPGFMGALIVETAWEGVKIGRDMPKMGLKASSTAAIQLKDVRVPVENLLGQPGEGFKIAMAILNYGRLGLGAASVAAMEQSLEDMTRRAASRIQFGSPIKDFALIQEKLVKAKVYGFVSSAMNDLTVDQLERDPLANAAIESSHCKLFGTTRGWDTLYDALQVAGGSGYIATQPYEKRMRDFRVTTVFEGTTEIHSIYPPLFVMRKIAKQIKALSSGRLSEILFLLKSAFEKMDWPLQFTDKTMRKASKLAKANARSIKRMLFLGLLLYGKKVDRKEFFLRRITTLSLYLYGLIAVLSRLNALQKTGTIDEETLTLLRYFIEEAREARKANRRLLDSLKEALTSRISQGFFKARR